MAYGDDMFRKVTVHNTIQCFLSRCFSLAAAQGEFSGAMRQYAAGALPLRAILRRFPDLIQGTGDAAADGGSHPVMKGEDPKFVQAVVQLVRECERTAPPHACSLWRTGCRCHTCRLCDGRRLGFRTLSSTRLCCAHSCGYASLRWQQLLLLTRLCQVNSGSVLPLLSSPNAVSLELGERLLLKQRLYVELAAL